MPAQTLLMYTSWSLICSLQSCICMIMVLGPACQPLHAVQAVQLASRMSSLETEASGKRMAAIKCLEQLALVCSTDGLPQAQGGVTPAEVLITV